MRFMGPTLTPVQWSESGRIRIHLGPWIQIQRYKMKGKAEFNQQILLSIIVNYIFKV